jgi:hypothetical protein
MGLQQGIHEVPSIKPRGRPRERVASQRIGPVVDGELLREFDAAANEEGLSRNKALEEAMRVFVSSRSHRLLSNSLSK